MGVSGLTKYVCEKFPDVQNFPLPKISKENFSKFKAGRLIHTRYGRKTYKIFFIIRTAVLFYQLTHRQTIINKKKSYFDDLYVLQGS